MKKTTRTILGAAAVSLATLACGAMAQAPVLQKAYCVNVGANPMEPVGDRPGHALQVSNYSCRTEGGPMDGGVMTGTNITEWDAGKAVILSGAGVGRKSGAMVTFQVIEGSMALIMTDGKVSGFNSSGRGVMKHASGTASVLMGKTYSYAVRVLTPGQFVIETTFD